MPRVSCMGHVWRGCLLAWGGTASPTKACRRPSKPVLNAQQESRPCISCIVPSSMDREFGSSALIDDELVNCFMWAAGDRGEGTPKMQNELMVGEGSFPLLPLDGCSDTDDMAETLRLGEFGDPAMGQVAPPT